jgi:hypothetical protein
MSYRGYAGRGRFQPGNSNAARPSKLLEDLSNQDLCSIPVPLPPFDTGEHNDVEATNVVTLGSYNWVDHSVPTIIVPGDYSLYHV